MECGWCKRNPKSNKIPVELEHIDGDASNNNLKNFGNWKTLYCCKILKKPVLIRKILRNLRFCKTIWVYHVAHALPDMLEGNTALEGHVRKF